MPSFSRAARRLAAVPLLLALAAAPVLQQPVLAKATGASAAAGSAPARAAGPWLYRGSDVPQDKAWVFGELPNGVRYAVRHNGVPPGQVSIRVRIDAGSLYESDSERGYEQQRKGKGDAPGGAGQRWHKPGIGSREVKGQ